MNTFAQTNKDLPEWWQDAKFGMFIHWGLFTQTEGYWEGRKAKSVGHIMLYEKIPYKEYGELAHDFNPEKYDPEKWVKDALDAGMKYLVITTKHHPGFAMYHSASSDYDMENLSPYPRDPMKELADACHKYGLKLGFYYSLGRDWQDPDVPTNWPQKGGRSNTWDFPDEDAKVFNKYFERKVKPQITELLTNYGKVDIVWFDTPELISETESKELKELILNLQPECIVNNRIENGQGDYLVLEQRISDKAILEPWESCITMSRYWTYASYDDEWKSPELLVRQLLNIISKGGNYLLNVAPDPLGRFPDEARKRLHLIGKWMDQNQEGIYNTKPWKITGEILETSNSSSSEQESYDSKKPTDQDNDNTSKTIYPEVRFTQKDHHIYAYVASLDDTTAKIISLSLAQAGKIKSISLLGSNKKIVWKQNLENLEIKLPKYPLKETPILGFKIEFEMDNTAMTKQ